MRTPKQPFRNIIFDFGGVICNIDVQLTESAFLRLGMRHFDKTYSITERDNFFGRFETGEISPEQFRKTLKPYFLSDVSDAEINEAWNALLLDIPAGRIELLLQLRNRYRLFLLSNTNQIHYEKYLADLQRIHRLKDFGDLFEKTWFSHQIGLRKPFPEVFGYVLRDASILPEETLFIDDSVQHVEGARKAGIRAYHLQAGEMITDLFTPGMDLLREV